MTNKEYDQILSFAHYYLRNKPHLMAEDIVNDVLTELLEAKAPFTTELAEKKVKNHPDVRARTVNRRGNDFDKSYTEKVCKECKELLPVAAFYIHNQPTVRVLSSNCKECCAKRKKQYMKSPQAKASNAECQRRWREKHPLRLKAIQQKYRDNNKDKVREKNRKYKEKLRARKAVIFD